MTNYPTKVENWFIYLQTSRRLDDVRETTIICCPDTSQSCLSSASLTIFQLQVYNTTMPIISLIGILPKLHACLIWRFTQQSQVMPQPLCPIAQIFYLNVSRLAQFTRLTSLSNSPTAPSNRLSNLSKLPIFPNFLCRPFVQTCCNCPFVQACLNCPFVQTFFSDHLSKLVVTAHLSKLVLIAHLSKLS